MSCSVAISSFLRHEVSFWVCGSAILILSAIVFVRGRALSAILYPTPEGIPFGITASAILSTGDYRTGDYRHWRVSCLSSWRWSLLVKRMPKTLFQQDYPQLFRENKRIINTYPHYPHPPVRNFRG